LDIAVFSSHKIYGPKGVGALYLNRRNKVDIAAIFFGGGQEKGMRPGTLNVPGIVGFGKAAEIASEEIHQEFIRISELRKKLEVHLEEIKDIRISSRNSNRLPNTINISFKNIDGNRLVRKLNGLSLSRGSACTSNILQPSHVLKAMGLSDELALSSLRISLGRNTRLSDIEFAAQEIINTVNQIKKAFV